MSEQFKKCLEQTLKYEGGWSWHKNDPGGATNKGVTIGTYRRFYPGATVSDLRNMTQAQLEKIYYQGYWLPIDGDGLGPGVDLAVFDLAVNSGVGRAKKMFRQVMKWHNVDNHQLIEELCDNRMAFLRRLKHWKTFGRGWTTRVSHVRQTAVHWALTAKPGRSTRIPKDIDHGGHEKAESWIDLLIGAILDALHKVFK